MKCSEVQRVLPECLDGVPDAAIQNALDVHLESCPACADLVSDLKQIASASRELAASDEPSPQVWLRIAAQLRAEGIIREPEDSPIGRPVLVPASRVRRPWNASAWWLAPVAAALIVAGSYVVNHKPAPQVASQVPAPAATTTPVAPTAATSPTTTPAATPASAPATEQLAKTSPKPVAIGQAAAASPAKSSTITAAKTEPELEPSTEDQQFLSVVSTHVPSMRAAYENQLQAVNADIREVQSYLQQNPGDLDARQHLMDAYQQKALLYQLALDRIQ
jgi:Putative zinc-finger